MIWFEQPESINQSLIIELFFGVAWDLGTGFSIENACASMPLVGMAIEAKECHGRVREDIVNKVLA